LRYVALLSPEVLGTVSAIVAEYGGGIDPVPDARRLLTAVASDDDDCLVVDPALITPAIAETIAATLAEFPRPVVALSAITRVALDSAVILAERTQARFIFRGVPAERSVLERALLLTPDMKLGAALLSGIDAQMAHLPSVVRDKLRDVLLTGDGAHSIDALAAATALTRRSIERYLTDAGFVSGTRLLDAARIVSGYTAVTRSRVSLESIARMLGRTMQAMDAQFVSLLGVSCGGLRAEPMSVEEVTERIVRRLTERVEFPDLTDTGFTLPPRAVAFASCSSFHTSLRSRQG
jgi:hypothetical protein